MKCETDFLVLPFPPGGQPGGLNNSTTLVVPESLFRARCISVFVLIATDATAGNRVMALTWTDRSGLVKAIVAANAVQVASQTIRHSWGMAGEFYAVGLASVFHYPLQQMIARGLDVVTIADVAAVSAGDTFTQGALFLTDVYLREATLPPEYRKGAVCA